MARIGYARVSTTDQDLALQLDTLTAAGCDLVRAEKVSGSTLAGRAELRTVLDFIAKGDAPASTASLMPWHKAEPATKQPFIRS